MSASALLTRRVANPLLRFVLSSPLHRPLSRSLLVLSYIGRRSGRRRATPVQYAHFGDDLALVAARASHKSWWRNFRDPAPVVITLRGRRDRAVAEVLRGDQRNAGLSAFLTRYPRAPRGRLRGYSRPLGARRRQRCGQLAVTSGFNVRPPCSTANALSPAPGSRAERDGLEHGKKTRAARRFQAAAAPHLVDQRIADSLGWCGGSLKPPIKAGHLAAVAPLKAQAPSR